MKKYLSVLCLLLAVVFTSCQSDDDRYRLYDRIADREWSGDLGFYQNGIYPLDSNVWSGADGFGVDELRFADDGRYLDRLRIRREAYDDGTIRIDYGRADYPRELRGVRIRRGRLDGDLCIGGLSYDRVTLYMR